MPLSIIVNGLGWMPARYVFAALGSMGMAIVYGLKVNLSVCIVAMVNNSALHHVATNTYNVTSQEPSCSYPEDANAAGTGGFEVRTIMSFNINKIHKEYNLPYMSLRKLRGCDGIHLYFYFNYLKKYIQLYI
jgi:hypothetical protein